MTYILVSLVGEGDEATEASDAFAFWYAERHPPAKSFRGDAPDHVAIQLAVQVLEPRKGFVLGHGGDTLRAFPGPSPLDVFTRPVVWANAEAFGQMFAGARVYVFACSTLAEKADAESFGRHAIRNGVAAYAGHYKPIHAPGVADVGLHDRQLRRAIARVVRMFLDGSDDVEQLLMEARSAISRGALVPLSTEALASKTMNDETLPLDWSLDWQRILGSLRVELPSSVT